MGTRSLTASGDESDSAAWPHDRFYDRSGDLISIEHWAYLHGDDEYVVVGDWSDDNGSTVRSAWTGFGFDYGYPDAQIFETNCTVGDDGHFYTYATEAEAQAAHDECVQSISRNIKPWSGSAIRPAARRRPESAPGVRDAASDATTPQRQPTNFIDRKGDSITLAQWAQLRRDLDYCLIDQWLGEGGAHVEVYWVGFDPLSDSRARPRLFGLCVAAFENCPLPDSSYRFFTEARALDHFRRIVPLVERGIRPWDDREVALAGFDPLVLRAR